MSSLSIMGRAGVYRLRFRQYSNGKWERIEKFISLPSFVGCPSPKSEILAPYFPKDTFPKDTFVDEITLILVRENVV